MANSPTGSNPRVLWTPDRQDVLNRMWADRLAGATNEGRRWADYYISEAEADLAGTHQYFGQYAALVYQMTGDAKWGRMAWDTVKGFVQSGSPAWGGLGGAMFDTWRYAVVREWIKTALTETELTQFDTFLLNWATRQLTEVDGLSIPAGDTDQVLGQFLGIAIIDGLLKPEPSILSREMFERRSQKRRPMGGLVATGADRSTVRNEVRETALAMAGGATPDGSEYFILDGRVLWPMWLALKQLHGKDFFPEIGALLPDFCLFHLNTHTPDGKGWLQWNDVERVRTPFILSRITLDGVLAGVAFEAGIPEAAYMKKLAEEHQVSGHAGLEPAHYAKRPYPEFGMVYNPYAPALDWRNALPDVHVARGQGVVIRHEGWNVDDATFLGIMSPYNAMDHEFTSLFDFQLYKNQEPAITRPIGWGWGDPHSPLGGDAMNSMRFKGLSYFREARGAFAIEHSLDHVYMVGGTGGHVYWEGYWMPPPPPGSWIRHLLYLPGGVDGAECFIIFDKTNIEDPMTFVHPQDPNRKYDRYEQFPDKNLIPTAPARKEWHLWASAEPIRRSNPREWQWRTAKGQLVTLCGFFPADVDYNYATASSLFGNYSNQTVPRTELSQFRIRGLPQTDRKHDDFLHVVAVGPLPEMLPISVSGVVKGVKITRPGRKAVVALFAGHQMADLSETPLDAGGRTVHDPGKLLQLNALRYHKNDFSVPVPLSGETDVFIFDLDPSQRWQLNGEEVSASPGGCVRKTLTADGVVDLSLVAVGGGPTPTPTPPPVEPIPMKIDIEQLSSGGDIWSVIATGSSPVTHTMEAQPDTDYTFRAVAVNEHGATPSDPVTVHTPPSEPGGTLPPKPTINVAVEGSSLVITASIPV